MKNKQHKTIVVMGICLTAVATAFGMDPGLRRAVEDGSHRAVGRLLYAGADVHATGANGQTVFHLAAANELLQPASTYQQQFAGFFEQPVYVPTRDGTSRHGKIARALLRKGADVSGVDHYGNTPLTIAAQKGHARMVRFLLEAGARPLHATAECAYDVDAKCEVFHENSP